MILCVHHPQVALLSPAERLTSEYCSLEFNAFDNDPWVVRLVEFVREILDQDRIRIIGVCYGHQIVGRALGAKVAKSEGGSWEVSVCNVQLSSKGKELFKTETLVRKLFDAQAVDPSVLGS